MDVSNSIVGIIKCRLFCCLLTLFMEIFRNVFVHAAGFVFPSFDPFNAAQKSSLSQADKPSAALRPS